MCLEYCRASGVVKSLVPSVAGNQGFRHGSRDTQTRAAESASSGSSQDTAVGLDKHTKQRLGLTWKVGIKG